MKALKVVTGIIFAIGILLIIGAIGQDDFSTMVLQEAHPFNWIQAIIGFLMMLPLSVSVWVKRYGK